MAKEALVLGMFKFFSACSAPSSQDGKAVSATDSRPCSARRLGRLPSGPATPSWATADGWPRGERLRPPRARCFAPRHSRSNVLSLCPPGGEAKDFERGGGNNHSSGSSAGSGIYGYGALGRGRGPHHRRPCNEPADQTCRGYWHALRPARQGGPQGR